ncbi:serine--tRNA ligase [Patescibacteria group bacterium AH-259-L05]|nr:serine--tRNA ligase [Patescibacteria group bacterium AH-259-L05]
MLDIKLIRKNPEKIKKACKDKQVNVDIDTLLDLDLKRRELIQELESLKAEHNKVSKQIAGLSEKDKKEAILKSQKLVDRIDSLGTELKSISKEFKAFLLSVPNIPLDNVPVGNNESDNQVLKKWGKVPHFSFKPKDHIELGKILDVIDTERASKVSGSRFGYIKNEAALLEFALVRFVFDTLAKLNFIPIVPPSMIRSQAMQAMGYLERGADEVYKVEKDDLYLIGTSEQSIGPMHMDEVLKQEELPKRYVAFSSCFRREAGSYGKDVKGILRSHQFDKIEMFSFCLPEESQKEHELFLSLEEELVRSLKIPYSVVEMCTGDLGDPTAATYDIECWIPSQNKYRETHSTSNCTDFQARRLNVRYRNESGKLEFVHTLNGTAFAIGRILIAILENYQQKDGSVKVPKVLQKYSGVKIIKKKRA